MKNRFLPALAALFLTSSALAEHREDDRRRHEGPRVILYQHAGFSGDLLVLYPGEAIDNLSGKTFENGSKLNDSITSIRVEGGAEVYAYENSRFRGEALRVTENTRDLTGRPVTGGVSLTWNDRISSLKVERGRSRDRDREEGPDRNPGRPGDDRSRGDPEKLVQETFQDLLGRAPSPGELRDFRQRLKDQGWNERMLRDHLRKEDPFRTEMAEAMVRRAYREVLERDVDPSGLKLFSWRMRDKGWSESDVRDHLRKSAEYRSKPRN